MAIIIIKFGSSMSSCIILSEAYILPVICILHSHRLYILDYLTAD